MNKDEIDIMWQQAMRESIKNNEMYTRYHFAKLVAEKALADHAMRETQRLGQEIEQEPAQRKPLTDVIITKVIDSMPKGIKGWTIDWGFYDFARAIEAAHGIKETT